MLFAEIDQQAEAAVSKSQIGQQLLSMSGHQLFYGLDFYDHEIIHRKTGTKADLKHGVFVSNRQHVLRDNLESSLSELMSQHGLVNRLQQTWPQPSMNAKGRIQHSTGDSIFFYFIQPLRTSATFA